LIASEDCTPSAFWRSSSVATSKEIETRSKGRCHCARFPSDLLSTINWHSNVFSTRKLEVRCRVRYPWLVAESTRRLHFEMAQRAASSGGGLDEILACSTLEKLMLDRWRLVELVLSGDFKAHNTVLLGAASTYRNQTKVFAQRSKAMILG